jgi:uncharacterized membrane protein YfhO
LIFFSIPYDPGWEITINSKSVEPIRSNIAFFGSFIEPGEYDVLIKYKSPWLKEGLIVSLSSTVILIGLLFLNMKPRIRQK